jgi:hypothetical protein
LFVFLREARMVFAPIPPIQSRQQASTYKLLTYVVEVRTDGIMEAKKTAVKSQVDSSMFLSVA